MRPFLKLIVFVTILTSSATATSWGKPPTLEGIPPLSAQQVSAALPETKTQPIVLMFKSRFCIDCKALLPILQQELSQPVGKGIPLKTVDILADRAKSPTIFKTFRPTTVPTLVFIARGGQIQESFVGPRTAAQIRQSLNALHVKKSAP